MDVGRSLQLFTMAWQYLAIAKPPLQIQTQESPRSDNVFICLGTFHISMAYFGSLVRWPTSTILLWYAHWCSAKFFFSSLLRTFRLFRAPFGYAKQFFCYTKSFSSILSSFSALPSSFQLCRALSALPTIFLLCWARLGTVKHISAMLSTFRLYQTFSL